MVDLALKSKADFTDMNEVRARLERLEILFSHQDMKQTAQLQTLREELTDKMVKQNARLEGMISEHSAAIQRLREDHKTSVDRLGSAEGEIGKLNGIAAQLGEVLALVRGRQENQIMTAISSQQERLAEVNVVQ